MVGQNKDVKPQDGDLSFKCGSTGPRLLEDLTGNHPWKHQSLLGACGLRRIYPYIYPNHIWNHMNTYGNLIIAKMMINLEILISLWPSGQSTQASSYRKQMTHWFNGGSVSCWIAPLFVGCTWFDFIGSTPRVVLGPHSLLVMCPFFSWLYPLLFACLQNISPTRFCW